MTTKPTQYVLKGKPYYARRDKASTLLFSLAKKCAKAEEAGVDLDAIFMFLSSDGDWCCHALFGGD